MKFFLLILTTMLFSISNHPFSMIFFLIILSMLISSISFSMMMTSWFSYIFLLIILSGVIMIFMYMATLSSNEYFTLTLIPAIMISPLIPKSLLEPPSSLFPQTWTMKQNLFTFSYITLFMVTFLFLTMMAVTKISMLNQGPLFSIS